MKKLLAALVIFVYFVPASIFLSVYLAMTLETQDASVIFIIPLLLMLAVCGLVAVNIAGAAVSVFRSSCLPFGSVMLFKLLLIPFYIINFACWAVAGTVFHIAIVVWPIIPFIIAYTYATMLGTSAHIIAKLFTLRRSGIITSKQFCVHCILQVFFAADVLDSVYLAVKQKHLKVEQ